MINVQVAINIPRLQTYIDAVGGQGLARLHAAMGTEVQTVTAAHLRDLHRSPGSLLSKLDPAPTGFFQQASLLVASPAALASDTNAATLTLSFVGVKRAFQSVTVVPKSAKYLAIPIDRIAVGQKPSLCWDAWHLFITTNKAKTQVCVAQRDGNQIKMLWVLKRSLTQNQDRTMLPSDAEWREAVKRGAADYLESL